MKETITQEEIEKATKKYATEVDKNVRDLYEIEEQPASLTFGECAAESFREEAKFVLGRKKDVTTQQDYKLSELECWCDFCNTEIARKNSFDRSLVKAANNFAFFRGYRFGKQEKGADGEEMLTVEKGKV